MLMPFHAQRRQLFVVRNRTVPKSRLDSASRVVRQDHAGLGSPKALRSAVRSAGAGATVFDPVVEQRASVGAARAITASAIAESALALKGRYCPLWTGGHAHRE